MDHSVKMWDIATEEVQDVVDASASHTHSEKRCVLPRMAQVVAALMQRNACNK